MKGRESEEEVARENTALTKPGERGTQESAELIWPQLPYDIINEIANRLDAMEDFLAFSFVCKSWQSVYREKTWVSRFKIPWLMLDMNKNGEHCFSLCRNKILHVPLPNSFDRRIWGSAHGWLIMIYPDLKIKVLNPITQLQVDLPPVSTLENIDGLKVDWFNLIHQAKILKLGTEFLVMAIYGPRNSLAFARLGAMKWTTVRSQLLFTSFTCYKGKILGLSIAGTLAVVEINEQKPPTASRLASSPGGENDWLQLHLVESYDDLLLVVLKKQMKVYRFDPPLREWKKLESLGDRNLLVDEYSCIAVSSCGSNNMSTGRIYLVQDNLWCFTGTANNKESCIHVYDMKRGIGKTCTFGSLVGGDCSSPQYKCPVWLIPSIR